MMLKRFWIYIININIYVTSFTPSELPGNIYEFCPYSNICNRTATRPFDADGLIPCCSSCGCDEDCGLNLDCCFEHLDKYKLVESGKIACIGVTLNKGNNKPTNSESYHYYMVQTCETDVVNALEQRKLSDACRLTDALGNSLIAPVSSAENDVIFINKECAACNLKSNASQIKIWNYLFIPELRLYETTVTFDIELHVKNKIGTLQYIAPVEENWSHKRCFHKYSEVVHCNQSNVWYDLCKQFRAPFQSASGQIYKSAFCVLCNGDNNMHMKNDCDPNADKWGSSKLLTFLLDHRVIEASKLNNIAAATTNIEKSENVCPSGYTEHLNSVCMVKHCPEGMLKTEDGCIYFALRWYTQLLVMFVKLVPKQGTRLLISQLKSFGSKERSNPFTWLRSPCRKLNLTRVEVYYSNTSIESSDRLTANYTVNYVTAFIIRITQHLDINSGVDPALTLPMFYKCARETWKAKLGNKMFKFNANFDKYTWYIKRGKQVLQKWPNRGSGNEIVRPIIHTLLAEGPFSIKTNPDTSIVLKKLFFCKHFRIPLYDVEINVGEIRIISRNVTLGTNEYIVNEPYENDWNKTTFSVCSDDYDPNLSTSFQNSSHEMSFIIKFIIGLVPVLLKCINV